MIVRSPKVRESCLCGPSCLYKPLLSLLGAVKVHQWGPTSNFFSRPGPFLLDSGQDQVDQEPKRLYHSQKWPLEAQKCTHVCVFGSENNFKPPSSALGAIKVHPSKREEKKSPGPGFPNFQVRPSKYFSTMGALWPLQGGTMVAYINMMAYMNMMRALLGFQRSFLVVIHGLQPRPRIPAGDIIIRKFL